MKKKTILKYLKRGVIFLFMEIVFLCITFPVIIFYGPYERVKKTVVGSLMETGGHQYIAKIFLSDNQIKRILGNDKRKNIQSKAIDSSKFKASDKIELRKIDSDKKFSGYMLIVNDPKRIKVGYSLNFGTPKMDVSTLASRYGAVAAINGGGYDFLNYNNPQGYIITNGQVKCSQSNNYNMKFDAVAMDKKGNMLVGSYSINDLKKKNVNEALCFGPVLVANGKGVATENDKYRIASRTAIGQRVDGATLLLVINGRSIKDYGASLKDIQDIMLKYNAVNAFNLDGGGSTVMYYNGEKLKFDFDNFNNIGLSQLGRAVPSIIYVK